ncbi:MAG: methyltransferase domain-containing protein [Myxococcales bacterium]|nr:methyltransferase domain-containing protein [Myxococcales bacterium]MCB9731577.1 methyltransferase domain-containing protein [Deltaproteobacteria bacterium]
MNRDRAARNGAARRTARAIAATALVRVEAEAASRSPEVLSDALVDAARRHALDPRERGLATELFYGVLRFRQRLDRVLAPRVRQRLDALEPVALALLRIGAYQILLLDRIPPPIAVSATQDAARELGAGRLTGLLNGVLRRVAEDGEGLPDGDDDAAVGARAALPAWIIGELRRAYGAATPAEAMALRERATTTVRPARAFGGPDAVAKALAEEGFDATPGAWGTLVVTGPGDPFATRAFAEGAFVPQDPASAAVVASMGDVSGLRVLDLCAGRGVKATDLAERGAAVTAVDVSPAKLGELERLAARLGVLDRVTTLPADGTAVEPPGAPFERVLVDAPCTGLGTLRRHPEIAWRRRPQDLTALTALQARLVAHAATLVAPGGELVYAVCSFARAEGDVEPPAGFVAVDGLVIPPSAGMDAFQVRRFRRQVAGA